MSADSVAAHEGREPFRPQVLSQEREPDPWGLFLRYLRLKHNAAKAQRELDDVTAKLEEIFDGLSTDVLETQLGAIHRRRTEGAKSNWTLITRE